MVADTCGDNTVFHRAFCKKTHNLHIIMFISAGLISGLCKLACIYGPQLIEPIVDKTVEFAVEYVKSRIAG